MERRRQASKGPAPPSKCPDCRAHDTQSQEYLELEKGMERRRTRSEGASTSGRSLVPVPGTPGRSVVAGKLRSALTSILSSVGRRGLGRGSAALPQEPDFLAELMGAGVFEEGDKEAVAAHLEKLPASYSSHGFSAAQVKEHMRLLQQSRKLKEGYAALSLEVRDDEEGTGPAGAGPDVSTSDSSCASFSTLFSDSSQVCRVEVSFACRTHICRPDLGAALKHAGFSVCSLAIFDAPPRGSLGTLVSRVLRDDCSQQVLEHVFCALLEAHKPRGWIPLTAGSGSRGSSDELGIENNSFRNMTRRCETEWHSSRGLGMGMGMGMGAGGGGGLPLGSTASTRLLSPMMSPLRGHRRIKTASAGNVEGLLHALNTGGDRRPNREDLSRFILNPLKLDVGPVLAVGASGEVRKGTYEGKDVAVKVLRSAFKGKDTAAIVADFKREVLALMACGECPHLLKFYGICTDVRSRLCIVTRLMKGGTLHDFLQSRGGEKLPQKELLSIASDVAGGMEFLHKNGITHRDLKSANVLLDGEGQAVVGDFGVAKLKGERGEMTKEVGTYRWMAPEAFGTSAWPVTHKADVYSFGIVLWELVSLSLPFESYTPVQAAVAVTLNGLRPPIPDDCPSRLRALIEACWEKNPDDRPEFAGIRKTLHAMAEELSDGEDAQGWY